MALSGSFRYLIFLFGLCNVGCRSNENCFSLNSAEVPEGSIACRHDEAFPADSPALESPGSPGRTRAPACQSPCGRLDASPAIPENRLCASLFFGLFRPLLVCFLERLHR